MHALPNFRLSTAMLQMHCTSLQAEFACMLSAATLNVCFLCYICAVPNSLACTLL